MLAHLEYWAAVQQALTFLVPHRELVHALLHEAGLRFQLLHRTCYFVIPLGGVWSNCQFSIPFVCALLHCCRAKLDFQICGLCCDFSPNTQMIGACNVASSCLVIYFDRTSYSGNTLGGCLSKC
jgi:hypothetical protein